MTILDKINSTSADSNTPLQTDFNSSTNLAYNETANPSIRSNINSLAYRILLAMALSPMREIRNFEPQNQTSFNDVFEIQNISSIDFSYNSNFINYLENLFNKASNEVFFDGEPSQFSKNLNEFFNKNGIIAIKALNDFLSLEHRDHNAIGEALNWIAELRFAPSRPYQWHILEKMLKNSNSKIRDAAVLGFSILNDTNAVNILKNAAANEPIKEIQMLMLQVAKELENNIP
jgi:hypothetical protein